jgi:hypothetical protein
MNLGRALSFCVKQTNHSTYFTAGWSGDDSVHVSSVLTTTLRSEDAEGMCSEITKVTCYNWVCTSALWQGVSFYQPIGCWFWNYSRIYTSHMVIIHVLCSGHFPLHYEPIYFMNGNAVSFRVTKDILREWLEADFPQKLESISTENVFRCTCQLMLLLLFTFICVAVLWRTYWYVYFKVVDCSAKCVAPTYQQLLIWNHYFMSEVYGMFTTYIPTKLPIYSDLILIATKPETKEKFWMDVFLVIITFNDGINLIACTYFQNPINICFKDI